MPYLIATYRALRFAWWTKATPSQAIELVALCWIALVRAESPTTLMNIGQVRGCARRLAGRVVR